MRRKLLIAVGGLAATEAVVWTAFKLRRPAPLPFRPDWLDEEVAKLHTPSCRRPRECHSGWIMCDRCLAGYTAFVAADPHRTWGDWFGLEPWKRESWRLESPITAA